MNGLSQAEVGHSEMTVRVEQEVGRLDVPVNQIHLVSVLKTLTSVNQPSDGLSPLFRCLRRPAPLLQLLFERATGEEVQKEYRNPLPLAHKPARDNPRMEPQVDPGVGFSNPTPKVEPFLVPESDRNLHGQLAIPLSVKDLVDNAHTTLAQELANLENATEHLPGEGNGLLNTRSS